MKSSEKYTLITGASKGLGRELAIECARRGNNLILVALPGSGLQEFCCDLHSTYNNRNLCFECDLTIESELEDMVTRVLEKYSVDRLINNAGVGGAARFEDISTAYLDCIIRLNIRATTILTYLLLPELKRHKGALILNISSVAAFGAMPYKTIYPASKAFIYSFSRGLNSELKGSGVRVAVIAPGPFPSNPDVAGRIMNQGAIARLGVLKPEEITRQAMKKLDKGRNVIIPGIWNKINRVLMHWIPERIRLSILCGVMARELPG